MSEQFEALVLAEAYADAVATHRLETLYGTSKSYTLQKAQERDEAHAALTTELHRLHMHEKALNEFLDKTEFIQDTAHFSELGIHRADVIRKRFEQADAREKYLSEKLEAAYEEIDEQARLLGMSAERELNLLAEIEQLKKVINKLVAQNPSESLISLLWGRTKG